MAEQCCADCTDPQKCGKPLPELSAAVGHEMWDSCECMCDENQGRRQERTEAHASPDINTKEADWEGHKEGDE